MSFSIPSRIAFTDIDGTLVHSSQLPCEHALVDMYSANRGGVTTIETTRVIALLGPRGWLIPVTTRNILQYRRMTIAQNFRFALVSNGARLLINGEEDLEWNASIRKLVPGVDAKQVFTDFKHEFAPAFPNVSLRLIDWNLVSASVDDSKELKTVFTDIDSWAFAKGWDAHASGRKLHLSPTGLSKGSLIAHFVQRSSSPVTWCAGGDSTMDESMLLNAGRGFVPRDSIISKRIENQTSIRVMESAGVLAATELVSEYSKFISAINN